MATTIGALLELLLANSQELFGDAVVNSSTGCSDPKLLEVKILRGTRKMSKGIKTMDFRRADFSLFRELFRVIKRESVLDSKKNFRSAGKLSETAFSKHKCDPTL